MSAPPSAFEQALSDPASGFAEDLDVDSESLLVFFTGVIGAIGVNVFEFANVTKGLGVKRIFLRDMDNTWYHTGVAGVSSDIDGTCTWLHDIIEREQVRRTVFIGSSAGGYGAILHGARVGVDAVHAFGAQTFIDRANRIRHFDRRGTERIPAFRKRCPGAPMQDLRPVLAGCTGTTAFELHYGDHRLDRVHAKHLEGLPGVTLHRYASKKHLVVKELRDTGALLPILEGSLH